MSQMTLDDDELFTEAATEMRADVEGAIEAARAALPTSDAVWEVESDNVLGVLNALRSSLDAGDAREQLTEAKKWYTMGQRAGAFDDGDELAAAIDEVEALFEQIDRAHEQVSELAATLPELRNGLSEESAPAAE